MGGGIDGGKGWQHHENASLKWQLGHTIQSVRKSAEYGLAGLHMVWGVACRASIVTGVSGLSFVGHTQVQ